jgi:hypothetical protein
MLSRTAMVYVFVSDLITGNWAEIYGLSNLYVSHNKGVSNGRFGRITSFMLYFDDRFYEWRLGSERTEPINLTNIYSLNQNPDTNKPVFLLSLSGLVRQVFAEFHLLSYSSITIQNMQDSYSELTLRANNTLRGSIIPRTCEVLRLRWRSPTLDSCKRRPSWTVGYGRSLVLEWLLTTDLKRKPVAKCDNKTSAHYTEQCRGIKNKWVNFSYKTVTLRAQHSLKQLYFACLDRDKHYQGRLSQQNIACFGEILEKTLTEILFIAYERLS